jgi:hypothetical protein
MTGSKTPADIARFDNLLDQLVTAERLEGYSAARVSLAAAAISRRSHSGAISKPFG